jgi:hypothetical protein
MVEGVTFELDIPAAMDVLIREAGALSVLGAEMIAAELRDAIPLTKKRSKPGDPPHSSGPLIKSIKSEPSYKVEPDRVVAHAYTNMQAPREGGPLLLVLDQGRGKIAPRPVIHAAVNRARERLQSRVEQVNQQFRSGG